jgi:triacylglycerol lipase
MHVGFSAIMMNAALLLLALALAALVWRVARRRARGQATLPTGRPRLPQPGATWPGSSTSPREAPEALNGGIVRPPEGSGLGEDTPHAKQEITTGEPTSIHGREKAVALAGEARDEGTASTGSPLATPAPAEGAPEKATLEVDPERGLVWVPSRSQKRGGSCAPRHPIVLAHGFGGFDTIQFQGRQLAYFRGVRDHLRALGAEVYVLRVSPVASIAVRAQQLAEQVRRLPAPRVNIVAHSMGGLDARYAIAGLGLAERTASLTTIGTPHRGTPLADLGVAVLGAGKRARGRRSIDAFHDLSTARMEAWNREVADVPSVEYGCFVSSAQQGVRGVNALLVPAYLFLERRAGANDGVVPATSQRWGQVFGEIDVDHWGAVGWSTRFDAARFYEELARGLSARGL